MTVIQPPLQTPLQPPMPTVAVVLVNYRAAHATQACLASLAGLDYPPDCLTIWVVDNGGDDWAVIQSLTQAGPFTVKAVRTDTNGGYSAGNNAAIHQALPTTEAIWLLNNDTQVQPDTLTALVTRWQQAGKPVLVGSVMHHPDGRFQQVATRVNLWTGSSKGYALASALQAPAVDSLSGASMLIPKPVFDAVGLLPEAPFLYFEDVAFCLAAKQAGFDCVIAGASLVTHHMGLATDAIPQKRSYYYLRNRWRVCWQYGHGLQRICLIAYGGVRLLRSMVKVLIRSSYAPQHQVFMLALTDALKGVSGPCPHTVLT